MEVNKQYYYYYHDSVMELFRLIFSYDFTALLKERMFDIRWTWCSNHLLVYDREVHRIGWIFSKCWYAARGICRRNQFSHWIISISIFSLVIKPKNIENRYFDILILVQNEEIFLDWKIFINFPVNIKISIYS